MPYKTHLPLTKAVWLDCDPGHDDAMAIILAGYAPEIRLLGISTVAGNQTVEKVTLNALNLLAAAGLGHIDVVEGMGKPLLRPAPLLCPEIHGETGMCYEGGSMQNSLDEGLVAGVPSRKKFPGKAANVMYQRIEAEFHSSGGQRVNLVATGALTNVAMLFLLYPEVVKMVDVSIMGGALGLGNTGAVMEFNIQTDPEAAKIVFEAGAPLTMVPLEVTHTALVTPAVLNRLCREPTPFLEIVRKLLLFFATTYRDVFRFEDPPLHDPCAVYYVMAPDAFETEFMRVDIETSSNLSAGQTVCDVWCQSGRAKNVNVAMSMDLDRFWDAMISALHAADANSPLNVQSRSIPRRSDDDRVAELEAELDTLRQLLRMQGVVDVSPAKTPPVHIPVHDIPPSPFASLPPIGDD